LYAVRTEVVCSFVGDPILAFHQAAWIVDGRYVLRANISREAAEQRNSISDENWHSSDDERLD
jgi:hypothetical protein